MLAIHRDLPRDVVCEEQEEDFPWEELPPEVAAAVHGNEEVTEDEGYVYGEIMAARKRTRANAQISSNDEMTTRERPAPMSREPQPKSRPAPTP